MNICNKQLLLLLSSSATTTSSSSSSSYLYKWKFMKTILLLTLLLLLLLFVFIVQSQIIDDNNNNQQQQQLLQQQQQSFTYNDNDDNISNSDLLSNSANHITSNSDDDHNNDKDDQIIIVETSSSSNVQIESNLKFESIVNDNNDNRQSQWSLAIDFFKNNLNLFNENLCSIYNHIYMKFQIYSSSSSFDHQNSAENNPNINTNGDNNNNNNDNLVDKITELLDNNQSLLSTMMIYLSSIETLSVAIFIVIIVILLLIYRQKTNHTSNVIHEQQNSSSTMAQQQQQSSSNDNQPNDTQLSDRTIINNNNNNNNANINNNNRSSSLLNYLNITILFSYLFSAVDSTIKSYFEQTTIINQYNYGHSGAYSMQGRRHNMEDCFSIHNNIGNELGIEYYSIFDGHGGQNAALFADKEIYESIVKRIKECIYNGKDDANTKTESNNNSNKDIKQQQKVNRFEALTIAKMKTILNEEIIAVDKRLLETFQRRSDISGSTALIAIRLLHLNKLIVANVGDSRGIICDSRGLAMPLSFDHKPYQLKEYRRILEAGGYISLKGVYRVNGILAISRALGDYPLKDNRLIIPDPDILSFDLNEMKPKFMIMATDGFWDTFTNENAVQFVNKELKKYQQTNNLTSSTTTTTNNNGEQQMKISLSTLPSSIALIIAKKLAEEAYERESYDNITVIVVFFDEDENNNNNSSSSSQINYCPAGKFTIKKSNSNADSKTQAITTATTTTSTATTATATTSSTATKSSPSKSPSSSNNRQQSSSSSST